LLLNILQNIDHSEKGHTTCVIILLCFVNSIFLISTSWADTFYRKAPCHACILKEGNLQRVEKAMMLARFFQIWARPRQPFNHRLMTITAVSPMTDTLETQA
jgi:hypothetical protein